jgi:hypothetical protein
MLKRCMKRILGDGKGPWLFASAVALALLVTPLSIAATSDNGKSVRGGVRNPSDNQSREFTRETEIIANTSTYGTRQSNKSDNGGGAIYGCRSGEGGTPKNNEPCIRAVNLAKGRAFEFATTGKEVGRIESSDKTAAPFTTNATGVATGLNADQVDGKSADDIVRDAQALTSFAAVNGADGKLTAGRGAASATRAAAGVYTVTFAGDVSKCAYTATVIGGEGAEGFASVSPVAADVKSLQVRTRAANSSGGINDLADRTFHLVATC